MNLLFVLIAGVALKPRTSHFHKENPLPKHILNR